MPAGRLAGGQGDRQARERVSNEAGRQADAENGRYMGRETGRHGERQVVAQGDRQKGRGANGRRAACSLAGKNINTFQA